MKNLILQINWQNSNEEDKILSVMSEMFQLLEENENVNNLKTGLPSSKSVIYYILGPGLDNTYGNSWAYSNSYPPITTTNTTFYLSTEKKLLTNLNEINEGQITYNYDPSDPVPTIGGNNFKISCGPRDQTSLYNRNDFISFVSEPLGDALFVCGKLEVVSNSNNST